jgi:hypothetical protein
MSSLFIYFYTPIKCIVIKEGKAFPSLQPPRFAAVASATPSPRGCTPKTPRVKKSESLKKKLAIEITK